MSVDRQQFWDHKILDWEADKYDHVNGALGKVFDVNQSLKKRFDFAKKILAQAAKGKTILELGCGSGRLMEQALKAGAKKYIGVDISSVAINEAESRAKKRDLTATTEFHASGLSELRLGKVDLVFSLGLLDWLDLPELAEAFKHIPCEYYFHSYSEKRFSLQQLAHRCYVYVLYGHKTKSYVPKYYSREQMKELFEAIYGEAPKFFRPNISFGDIVYKLPEGMEPCKT
jgi:SAM-dependent methyltransferase